MRTQRQGCLNCKKIFMTPIHGLGKVNRANYIQFPSTDWMVCVSVYVYTFLSVVCYNSRCLAQCSGISATVTTLLESSPAICTIITNVLFSQFLLTLWDSQWWLMGSPDYHRVNEFDYWLITLVLYVLFFHMFPKRHFHSPLLSPSL